MDLLLDIVIQDVEIDHDNNKDNLITYGLKSAVIVFDNGDPFEPYTLCEANDGLSLSIDNLNKTFYLRQSADFVSNAVFLEYELPFPDIEGHMYATDEGYVKIDVSIVAACQYEIICTAQDNAGKAAAATLVDKYCTIPARPLLGGTTMLLIIPVEQQSTADILATLAPLLPAPVVDEPTAGTCYDSSSSCVNMLTMLDLTLYGGQRPSVNDTRALIDILVDFSIEEPQPKIPAAEEASAIPHLTLLSTDHTCLGYPEQKISKPAAPEDLLDTSSSARCVTLSNAATSSGTLSTTDNARLGHEHTNRIKSWLKVNNSTKQSDSTPSSNPIPDTGSPGPTITSGGTKLSYAGDRGGRRGNPENKPFDNSDTKCFNYDYDPPPSSKITFANAHIRANLPLNSGIQPSYTEDELKAISANSRNFWENNTDRAHLRGTLAYHTTRVLPQAQQLRQTSAATGRQQGTLTDQNNRRSQDFRQYNDKRGNNSRVRSSQEKGQKYGTGNFGESNKCRQGRGGKKENKPILTYGGAGQEATQLPQPTVRPWVPSRARARFGPEGGANKLKGGALFTMLEETLSDSLA